MSGTALVRGTLSIPETAGALPASSREEMDAALTDLVAHRDEWAQLPIQDRIHLVDRVRADTYAVVEQWVAAGVERKHLTPETPATWEEWIGPVLLLRSLRLLGQALGDIVEHGHPQPPGKIRTLPNGQVSVRVLPTSVYDNVLFTGVTGDLWMEPGVSADELADTQALVYRPDAPRAGKVALVLGAGNVSAIPPMDAISKLFVENQVVVLKMNPVNEYIGPVLEQALGALVERGFLRFVYGGATQGGYLTNHPSVDEIHITGSDKTHDAIVFGSGEEGLRRKEQREPLLDKRITSELGNLTPVIVVPGPWSDGDIRYHAENIVTMLTNNAGFNCVAVRNVITHRRWVRRHDLLDAIRDLLITLPGRYAYYPGALDRYRAFVDAHPEAERFGEENDETVPWTFIPGLDASAEDEICFTTESFNGVFGEVPLDTPTSVPQFVDAAVRFCNERLWGSLAVTIIVHPRSLRDRATREAVDRALHDLRYGSVVVNHWAGLPYGLATTPWGAYPGHDIDDIQSGRGSVHNFLMYDRPQKSVVRGPFRARPKPAWFVTHRTSHEIFRRLVDIEMEPSPAKVAGVVRVALRG